MRELETECVVCGCTQSNACDGGCCWAQNNPAVCDRCAGRNPYQASDGSATSNWIVGPGPEGEMGDRLGVWIENDATAIAVAKALNAAFALGRRAGVATMDLSGMQNAAAMMADLLLEVREANKRATLATPTRLDQMRRASREWGKQFEKFQAAEARALRAGKAKRERS